MKKITSCIVTASLFVSMAGTPALSLPVFASSLSENTITSITDLSKYETNDIIVVYKKGANATKQRTLSICGISDTGETAPQVSDLTDNSVVLKLDSQEALAEAVEHLSQDNRVDYIQPNYIYHALDTDITSTLESLQRNSDFTKQWGLYNDGTLNYSEVDYSSANSGGNWWWSSDTDTMAANAYGNYDTFTVQAQPRVDIHLPEALTICPLPKREAVVAIIDTGVKYDHSELSNYMWVNEDEIAQDGIDNDNNGYIDDIHGWNFYGDSSSWFIPGQPGSDSSSNNQGNNTYYNSKSTTEDAHGTHGAGSIAAADNDTGIAGIAANANVKIMTVKALGGKYGYGSTESIIKGIQYAEQNGAHICNLSLGGDDDDTALRNAIEASSMLFTIAAGNGDSNYKAVDTDSIPTYPSCYTSDNIINIANIQCDGQLHYTSNYGASSVDIAAPGSKIYSTSTDSSGYEEMTGTSMSAPMVAGVAAMLYSYYDNISLTDIKNAILNSATPLSSLEGKCVTGGMLNAYDAIRCLNGTYTPDAPIITVTAIPTQIVTPEPTATEVPSSSPQPTATPTPVVTTSDKQEIDFLSISDFKVSGSGTKYIGKTYTISASALGGFGTYQYRFLVSLNGKTKMIQNYSSAASIRWKPDCAGTYNIRVSVVDENGDYDIASKEIVISPLKITSIAKNKTTLKKGTKVKLKAKVSAGIAPISYKFVIKKSGKTVLNKTTSQNYVSWKIPAKGTYKLKITVKDSVGNTASKSKTYKVKK